MLSEEVFKALADAQRRRILTALNRNPRRAGDLGRIVGLSPNALSFHLRLLRQAGLVNRRREGRNLVYSAVPAVMEAWLRHVRQLWPAAWAAVMERAEASQSAGGRGTARVAEEPDGQPPGTGSSTKDALATELL